MLPLPPPQCRLWLTFANLRVSLQQSRAQHRVIITDESWPVPCLCHRGTFFAGVSSCPNSEKHEISRMRHPYIPPTSHVHTPADASLGGEIRVPVYGRLRCAPPSGGGGLSTDTLRVLLAGI